MITLIAGLLPAIVLVCYIYRTDYLKPEPVKQVVRAALLGVCSCFVSFFFSIPFGEIGLYSEEYSGPIGAFCHALFGAALPEELAKLIILWLVVRKNPHFDEKMDGIVYAVCVGMGFAGLENVLYLDSSSSFIFTFISRALLSIPGHFCFAVFMGYNFSKFWFEKEGRMRHLLLALLSPVAAHTAYDFILMYQSVNESVLMFFVLMVAFIYSCRTTYRWARRRINDHLSDDVAHPDGYLRDEHTHPYVSDHNDIVDDHGDSQEPLQ